MATAPQPYPEGTQTKGIVTPHEHDVLSGRGNFVNYHAGNEHFRALVKKHKIAYVACPKPEKGKFSKIIVDEIRSMNPSGRFLKQDPTTKLWEDIGEKKSLDKTRQALREGAPELMKELTGDDEGELDHPGHTNISQVGPSQAQQMHLMGGGAQRVQDHPYMAQMQQMSQQAQSAQIKTNPTLSGVRRDPQSIGQGHVGQVTSSQFATGESPDVHHSNIQFTAEQLRMVQQGQINLSSFAQRGGQVLDPGHPGHPGGMPRQDQQGNMPLSAQAQMQQLMQQIPVEALEPTPMNPYAGLQQAQMQAQAQLQELQAQVAAHERAQQGGGGVMNRGGGMMNRPAAAASHMYSSAGAGAGTGTGGATLAAATRPQPEVVSSHLHAAREGGRRNSLNMEEVFQGGNKPSSTKAAKNMGASSTNMSFSVGDIDSNLSSAFDDSLQISIEGGDEDKIKNKGSSGSGSKLSKSTPPPATINEEAPQANANANASGVDGTESALLKGMTHSEAAMSFSLSDAADLLGSSTMQMSYRQFYPNAGSGGGGGGGGAGGGGGGRGGGNK